MTNIIKPAEELTVADIAENPVWEFINDDAMGETAVRPVLELPVATMDNRIIGLRATLANGKRVWCLIGNIDFERPRRSRHFMSFSFEHKGAWFHLGRYFDPWYNKESPEVLAQALGMQIGEVFPITYDLRPYAASESSVVTGSIPVEPPERLSRQELWALKC